jgi:NNP family nitrate/nitrite transporter-like MFS transporter
MSRQTQALSVLIVSTLAFTVCFMVWMMFGVIGIPLKKTLGLNATEFGLLTAMPVLTGSLMRVPLGIWTDKYGGRIVMAAADGRHRARHLADGLRHAVLAVPGDRPLRRPGRRRLLGRHALRGALVPEGQQGFAMGVFGAGNSGAAVNKFVRRPGGGLRLDHGAAGLRGGDAGHADLFWLFSHSDPRTWCRPT